MTGRQTRRQAAKAAQRESSVTSDRSDGSSPSRKAKPANGKAAARAATAPSDDADYENIFLFWPNIIGYSRIILAVASLYYMPLHPRTCSLLYSISELLDALDGYAARYFNQSTRFGAVLDMVTDRCTTACLIVFLSSAFPRWAILFQGLIALDLASHYMHMYATLVVGGVNTSHKNIDKSQSWLLNLYYTNRSVLFIFCAANELFFIALYLLSFSSPLLSPYLLTSVAESGAGADALHVGAQVNTSILSQIFPDPYSAAALELARANKMDSFIPWVLAGISFPIMAMKQIINVVQLVKASKGLAAVDRQDRRALGLPKKKTS
ncbi:related to CDP diacylglycerol-inositol 3-phosphatidyltransferase [Cephalotrichum gorgonifer]|uniref:Related to CDP diacylglycerol-inositol 3-phosphatidyltransferase n=1 Tax=Cephalotrichum gorgonifer TaxID=2041049 RepID=A0AAE8N5W3_9PEZI|nr:related to CDP diacylglycerol-inositol 3-phosphatidyltransferase [Cephalotrichum gorgonifer]